MTSSSRSGTMTPEPHEIISPPLLKRKNVLVGNVSNTCWESYANTIIGGAKIAISIKSDEVADLKLKLFQSENIIKDQQNYIDELEKQLNLHEKRQKIN